MTPENYLLRKLMLPHLKLIYVEKISNKTLHYHCDKTTEWEVCRKCPKKSFSIHDHRTVSIRDTKFHTKNIRLIIRKRRFRCPSCKSVFNESINGIKVGFRTTEKYRNQILHNYKNFIEDYFPNAKIVIDKFHVIRLIHPAIRKYRKEVTGDKRSNPIRHLLLKNRKRLQSYQKRAVTRFCQENEKVNEVYRFKERIVNFYKIKGFNQASRVFTKITDDMARSKLKEIKTLRKTLMKWREEILRYFKTGLTNARVEGFNRKCKLIQRTSFGLKSFENYRLRALYRCS